MAEHKKATTVDEQIDKLKSRGMIIDDNDKVRENLLDIGYYRLGFIGFLLKRPTQEKQVEPTT